MYNIEFYEDSNGRSELWDFLESLNDTFVLLHQFRKKLKKLPSAKLNEQRPNVMITLPERRLNDYENLE